MKSVLLSDQKVETTHYWPKLELRFLKSVSIADQKVEITPWPELELRFLSECQLLIKRQRQPTAKVGT